MKGLLLEAFKAIAGAFLIVVLLWSAGAMVGIVKVGYCAVAVCGP